jgi:hypothetical protein
LTCTQVSGSSGATSFQNVTCPSGSRLMGGGCSSPANTTILDSYPESNTSWFCRTTAGAAIQAMAICCDVSF